jgi:hypothetical protein
VHSLDYTPNPRPSPANTPSYRPLSILEDFDASIDLERGVQQNIPTLEGAARSRGNSMEVERREDEARR